MWIPLRAYAAVFVTLLALALARATKEHLLANKCCPLGQQLKWPHDECIPLSSSNDPSGKQETVAEARGSLPEDAKFPLWMDSDATLLVTGSEENIAGYAFGFLQNASQNAVMRYGHRPCAHEDTQYLYSPEEYKLFPNGTLQLTVFKLELGENVPQEENIYLTPDDWCSDRYESPEDRFVLLTCPCKHVTCVPRCCYWSMLFHVQYVTQHTSSKCFYNSSTFIPSFYKEKCFIAGRTFVNSTGPIHVIGPTESAQKPKTSNFTESSDNELHCDNSISQSIIYTELENHKPRCKSGYAFTDLNYKPSWEKKRLRPWLQPDGSALLENFGRGRHYSRHEFCIERGLIGEGPYAEEIDTVLFCDVIMTTQPIQVVDIYYIFVILIVSVFILLTLATHAVVPALRRGEHSKALCCHCGMLLVASLTLMAGHVGVRLTHSMCRVSAFLVQFSFLASLFWLNVMCFDFTRTFRQMRQNFPARRKSTHRFLFYSLYAWGCPTVVLAITIGIEYLPYKTMRHDHPLRPNIGTPRCWFRDTRATLVYYYTPNAMVFLANLVMFGMTVQRIYAAKRGTSIIRKGDANATKDDRRSDSEMYSVVTRLFLLMGVTWVLEIITWSVTDNGSTKKYFYRFIVMDTLNLVRGVAIFVITCCKRHVAEELLARARAFARRCGCKGYGTGSSSHPGEHHASHASESSLSTQSSGIQLSESAAMPPPAQAEAIQETSLH